MEGNEISDQTLYKILESMKYNLSVKLLNLSHNNFSKVGAKHLKHYLATNSTLRVLLLHWNCFGGIGGKRIAKALTTNSIL
jgi:Ran GTPase-activating protein (RanGAP) involved in mRNA processing and transport